MTRAVFPTTRVHISDGGGMPVIVRGRDAWSLRMLVASGELGDQRGSDRATNPAIPSAIVRETIVGQELSHRRRKRISSVL